MDPAEVADVVEHVYVPEAFRLALGKGISAIDWSDFEKLAAQLFEEGGYDVKLTPSTDDQGIDLLLRERTSGELDVAQCKHWKDPIGSPIVRDFYGAMIHFKARKGFLITTAGLTDSAMQFCSGKPIVVWGADDMIDEIFRVVIYRVIIGERSLIGPTASARLDQIAATLNELAKEKLFGKGLPELREAVSSLNQICGRLRNANDSLIITP